MNVNTNIVIPKFTPMPQMKIPPYLLDPPANTNARTRRRGAQPRGTPPRTTTLNLNLSPPPPVIIMPRNRNADSSNRNTPPRE